MNIPIIDPDHTLFHPDESQITQYSVTGMFAPTWHFAYQEWECSEGTIRRMIEWPDGRTKYPEVLWKWSYLKPLLETQGITIPEEGEGECHIAVQGHNLNIGSLEGEVTLVYDGMEICWAK